VRRDSVLLAASAPPRKIVFTNGLNTPEGRGVVTKNEPRGAVAASGSASANHGLEGSPCRRGTWPAPGSTTASPTFSAPRDPQMERLGTSASRGRTGASPPGYTENGSAILPVRLNFFFFFSGADDEGRTVHGLAGAYVDFRVGRRGNSVPRPSCAPRDPEARSATYGNCSSSGRVRPGPRGRVPRAAARVFEAAPSRCRSIRSSRTPNCDPGGGSP